jgi:eukaryotic-like serine/threonine-protein kinase
MKKVAASGGVPQVIATASAGRGGAWGKRGLIIYSPQPSGWLWSVNADGSNPVPLTQNIFDHTADASHRWPVFLPDGDHFLFYAGTFTISPNDHSSGIYLSSLTGKERKLVYQAPSNPGYALGYLYFTDSERRLDAIAFDPAKGVTSGEQRVVAEKVGFQPSVYWGAFSVAENGTVVYSPTVGASLSILTWYDRAGKMLGNVGDAAVISNPSLSPDNQRAVMDIADEKANNVNIWLSDLQRGTSSRFTFDTTEDSAAAWSRDGSMIVYRSSEVDTSIFVKASRGSLEPRKIFEVPADHSNDDMIPNAWSPDGKQVLCVKQPGEGGSELDLLPVTGGNPIPFLKTSNEVTAAQISPDGKWVAYASQESGDWEIYVTAFPSAAGKWQVSRGDGAEPRWRGDGKEIFYIGPKSMLTAVAVSSSDTFSAGNATPLFRAQLRASVSSTDMFAYDVTKDGQRFVVDRYAKPTEISPLRIVLNATAGLEQ